MHSCIYVGQVRHRRFAPRLHTFRYPLFMMLLDLAELPQLFKPYWFWSSRRPAPAWFRRQDYLGPPHVPLADALKNLVRERTGKSPQGPIRLLTHLRYFGYGFNPVSFYYCFDAQDEHVETVVAQVTNTPWGEVFYYVLAEEQNHGTLKKKQYHTEKSFHVSPFMDMEMDYRWYLQPPGKKLVVHIKNYQGGSQLFDATLSLKREEISSASLAKILLSYPLMTLKVSVAIYYEACKLWLKKIPFHNHPERP